MNEVREGEEKEKKEWKRKKRKHDFEYRLSINKVPPSSTQERRKEQYPEIFVFS